MSANWPDCCLPVLRRPLHYLDPQPRPIHLLLAPPHCRARRPPSSQFAASQGCVLAMCMLARCHAGLEPVVTSYAYMMKVRPLTSPAVTRMAGLSHVAAGPSRWAIAAATAAAAGPIGDSRLSVIGVTVALGTRFGVPVWMQMSSDRFGVQQSLYQKDGLAVAMQAAEFGP
eukprot:365084-Chlamydomonas_euryale.AAC.3